MCLSNDSQGEPYLLQKLNRILGCADPWAQPVVKDLWQLQILDKMEREKGWSQQALQLDVVCGYEHLRVQSMVGAEDPMETRQVVLYRATRYALTAVNTELAAMAR